MRPSKDNRKLYEADVLHVNPTFTLSGALGGADGDLIADGRLVDFKATKDRSIIGSVDLYQLVGYALADSVDEYGIKAVGISALRWRTSVEWPVEELLERLSGETRSLVD